MTHAAARLTKTERRILAAEIDWQENRSEDDACQPDQLDEFSESWLLQTVYLAMNTAAPVTYRALCTIADKLEGCFEM